MNSQVGLTAADFQQQALALLPRGPIWPREDGMTIPAYWAAVADILAVLHGRIADFSERESDPFRTSEMLPDWEAAYGLPDHCSVDAGSTQQRRAALLWKIAVQGGQSAAYFIALAKFLGWDITITEPRSFRAGSKVGTPLYGSDWNFVWIVNAAIGVLTTFKVGISTAGDPLASWGNSELECRLRDIAPAHTILLFSYS